MSRVEHPVYYNRQDGIECIDVIRHYVCDIANALKYLWRAGLKTEMGIPNKEKEIEDLNKALWYINDYIQKDMALYSHSVSHERISAIIKVHIGHYIEQIVEPYEENVKSAMFSLLHVGLVSYGRAYCITFYEQEIKNAQKHIEERIHELEESIQNKGLV